MPTVTRDECEQKHDELAQLTKEQQANSEFKIKIWVLTGLILLVLTISGSVVGTCVQMGEAASESGKLREKVEQCEKRLERWEKYFWGLRDHQGGNP